jgi:hypothetical protein
VDFAALNPPYDASILIGTLATSRLSRLRALAHGIIDDFAMIESEIEVLPIRDEGRVGGIISGTGIVPRHDNPVGDAHDMPPRVAMRVGVNSNQRDVGRDETRLLSKLAGGGPLSGLPVFDVSAGQRILSAEGRMLAANKQQPAARVEHDAVDGKRWMFSVHDMQPRWRTK